MGCRMGCAIDTLEQLGQTEKLLEINVATAVLITQYTTLTMNDE